MKKISFGVDIGGINSAIGIVDRTGKIYCESVVSTKSYPYFDQYPNYVEALAEAMRGLLSGLDFEYELMGIGIGAPNASSVRGTIEQPANLWKYRPVEGGEQRGVQGEERGCVQGVEQGEESARVFSLVEDLKRQFPQCESVKITNDANAATIGEMVFGAAQGMQDFAMVTLGTGLGSGFVANGEMIYGTEGFAGELGHICAVHNGRECGCGLRGCIETYVSATGICRTAFELMATMRDKSVLRDIPFNKLDSLQIAQAAEAGDPIALEAFRYTAELLGRVLGTVVTIFTPEAIVLFGGLAKAGKILIEPTKLYMDRATLPSQSGKTKLLASAIKGNVAIMGAAALILK